MIKYVIFDLDGVILDTETINVVSKVSKGKALGYNIDPQFIKSHFGMNYIDSEVEYKKEYGEAFPFQEVMKARKEYILSHINEFGVPFKKGFIELIKYLKENNYKCAIATSTRKDFLEEYKRKSSYFDMFDEIVTGEQISLGKPHPDIFIEAARRLSAPEDDCLVLEDSYMGIKAALGAKMKVCMVVDLLPPRTYEKENCCYIADSLLDVITFLKNS